MSPGADHVASVLGATTDRDDLHPRVREDHEDGCHLATGDRIIGAVAVVRRRVAAFRDAGSRQCIDVVLEHAVVIVREEVQVGGTEREGPAEKGRHLAAGHRVFRTELVVEGWITADSQLADLIAR